MSSPSGVVVTEGECEISIAGRPHRVIAGHLLCLPAGQPHAVRALTPFTMLLIMIREGHTPWTPFATTTFDRVPAPTRPRGDPGGV